MENYEIQAVKEESFRDLVANPRALAFARGILIESYAAAASGHEGQVRALMKEAFHRLETGWQDVEAFPQVVAGLREEVFRKSQAEFWFNQVYAGYKSNFKPKRRFQNLEEWLKGDTLLDLGCGDGLTSYEIQQHGYRVYLSDVLDYRHPKAQGLPFQSMPNPHEIPFPRQNFDMALSFAVLHHVAEQDLLPLLSELRQRARRVIVEEDSYAVPREVRGYEQAYREDQQFRAYAHLPLADQVRYLMFVDYFANAITQGLVEMEIPFHFRSVGEWWEIFSKSGFEVKQTRLMGFQQGFFNRSCHVWFLLE